MKSIVKFLSLTFVLLMIASLFVVKTTTKIQADTLYGTEYSTKYMDKDQVMTVDILMKEENWEMMMKNASKEDFQVADVKINGDMFRFVNIRPKGNSSLNTLSREAADAADQNKRYSFKINFGDLLKGQTMGGLTQLNLNNCFSDPSYMREYLSYQIFKEMEVPVPVFCYAKVSINGKYLGLYLAVESILEPYLERNFGTTSGTLYKSTGNTLTYTGVESSDTKGLEVKTTTGDGNVKKLTTLLKSLKNGDHIEKVLDVDKALRYIAVSTALVNFDSYQGNFAHNYYLYEKDGKFTILPWDLNMSFGGFNFGSDPSKLFIDEPTQGEIASRPLIAKLLEKEEYLLTYHQYLQEIVKKFLHNDYLGEEITRLKVLIADLVNSDPTAFYTSEQFQQNTTLNKTSTSVVTDKVVTPTEDFKEQEKVVRVSPAIIPLAISTAKVIQQQLDRKDPSTNNGKGMESDRGEKGPMQPPPGVKNMPEGGNPPREGMMPPVGTERRPMMNGAGPGQPPDGTLQWQNAVKRNFWLEGVSVVLLIGCLFCFWFVPKRKWCLV